jgi:hypothetical protein
MILLWVLAGVITIILATLGYFAWRMMQSPNVNFAPEWVAEFSPARYRPMERLLSEDDFELVARKAGDRSAAPRLRSERRRIFRLYLSQMNRDFTRLQTIGKLMVLYSPQDRSDLVWIMLRQEAKFRALWLSMHFRLVLHAAGIGNLGLGGLVEPLGSLSEYIRAPQLAA